MIRVFNSNRLEKLADIFGNIIHENPLKSPFEKEIILVQSIGMGRWLSLKMAEESGIWAGFTYKYPNAFFNELSDRTILSGKNIKTADKKTACWEIFNLLKKNQGHYSAEITNYCSSDILKTWQLSEKISDLFDQYSVYRSDMIARWDKGDREIKSGSKWVPLEKSDMWQADLWHDSIKLNFTDRAVIHGKLIEFILSDMAEEFLPERVSVFGVSTIPRYHLEIIKALSLRIPVYFYLLNPCSDFWYHDRSVKEVSRIKRDIHNEEDLLDQHLETGNTLLSSLGRLGLEFHTMIMETFGNDNPDMFGNDAEHFERNGTDTLLRKIQNDILLRTEREYGQETEKVEISPEDCSVQIHSCYSIQREIEALHDSLLDIFRTRPDISPRDVLVMTTDIETYAPYIETVFSSSHDENAIPYSIADLNLKKSFEIAETLIDILKIRQKRFSATFIFDLLQRKSIKSRFSISDEDIEILKIKTSLCSIRWGTDETFRNEITGIPYDENSWMPGIERFLTGLTVMPEDDSLLFGNIPFNEIEDINPEVLGNFIDFIKILKFINDRVNTEMTLEEWIVFLENICSSVFYEEQNNSSQFNEIRSHLEDLKNAHNLSSHTGKIPFEVIMHILDGIFSGERVSFGFLDGRITFCAVLPMRSIPFKVIAMLGLNDGVFPATDKPLSFDLTANNRMFGDRTKKNDDRYLFLENIISTRDIFYISYIGKSATDDSSYPPSTIVSELVNYISDNFFIKDRHIKNEIIREHKLHPFSLKYFTSDDWRFFSYSEDNLRLLESGNKIEKPEAVLKPSAVADELLDISISNLVSFLVNPSKYFLQRKLGIYFENDETGLDDDEPFELEFSDSVKMLEKYIEKYKNSSEADSEHLLRTGYFPPQDLGRYRVNKFLAVSKDLFSRISKYLDKYEETAEFHPVILPVESMLGKYELKISNPGNRLPKNGILIYREKIWNRDYINTFLHHAFCCLQNPAAESAIMDLHEKIFFPPLTYESAYKYITEIASLYINGLIMPLPFFLKAATEFSSQMARPDADIEKALGKAASRYFTSFPDSRPDYECEYISYLFHPDLYLYRKEFIQAAETVTGTIFKNIGGSR